MNTMNNVLDQVLTSSRVYLAWLALRTPEAAADQPNGSTPGSTPPGAVAPALFNQSWNQFSALTTPVHGIPELSSPLSD